MPETRTTHIRRPLAVLTILGCALLAACGGGGGSAAPTPTLVDASAVTRGFWAGTITGGPDGSTRASAIVMTDLVAWVAFETASGVVGVSRTSLSATATDATTASVSGSGTYYPLSGAASRAVSASGTTTGTTLQGTLTVGGTASAMTWTPVSGYTAGAATPTSPVAGTFTGALGGGTVRVTWAIDALGSLVSPTSVSTTGCTYSGSLKPSAGGIAVFDVAVKENCAGTTRDLAGVATLRAASGSTPASLRVIYTADAGATGGLLALDKQ